MAFRPMELQNQTWRYFRTLEQAPERLRDVLLSLRRERHRIAGEKKLSPVGMRAETEQARGKADAAFQVLADETQQAEAAIRAALRAVRPTFTAEQALLRESQMARAWGRYRRLLEAGKNPVDLAQLAAGDPIGLAVLREELPAYLEAVDSMQLLDLALQEIDRAERPLLSDVEQLARELGDTLDAGMYRLRLAFSYAEAELNGEWEQATMLPGWEKDRSVQVVDPLGALPALPPRG